MGGVRAGPGPEIAAIDGTCIGGLDDGGGSILECGWTAGDDDVGGSGYCLWLVMGGV